MVNHTSPQQHVWFFPWNFKSETSHLWMGVCSININHFFLPFLWIISSKTRCTNWSETSIDFSQFLFGDSNFFVTTGLAASVEIWMRGKEFSVEILTLKAFNLIHASFMLIAHWVQTFICIGLSQLPMSTFTVLIGLVFFMRNNTKKAHFSRGFCSESHTFQVLDQSCDGTKSTKNIYIIE